MEKRPELYTAFLCCATQWDGDMAALVNARMPVYMVTGENDSYYGSKPLKDAYEKLHDLYLAEGLTENEIAELVILDIKEQKYFTDRGYKDQHMGGQAHEESFGFDIHDGFSCQPLFLRRLFAGGRWLFPYA